MEGEVGCAVQAEGTSEVLRAADLYIRDVFRLIPRSVFSATEAQAFKEKAMSGKEKAMSGKEKAMSGKKNSKKKQRQLAGVPRPAQPGRDTRQLPIDSELSAKLQQKLSGLRAARRADDETAIEKRVWKKRKREEKAGSKASSEKKRAKAGKPTGADGENVTGQDIHPNYIRGVSDQNNSSAVADTASCDASGIAGSLQLPLVSGFAGDDLGDQRLRKATKRGKKRSKLDVLNLQLEKAEEDRAKSEKLQTESRLDTVDEVLNGEMEKAMMRVQGVNVKDKASKLRKTIRKEKRKKEKSREEWAKRTETAKADKEARQQTREERLKERRENKGKPKSGKSSKTSKVSGKGKSSTKNTK
jgi:hypothetical protein